MLQKDKRITNINGFWIYPHNQDIIPIIVKQLFLGKLIVVPTDTVAGLVGLVADKIYWIKKRANNKKLVFFINSWKKLKINNPVFVNLAQQFWPGPLTLIHDDIAYRCPKDPFLLNLLEKTPMLYATSANLTNHPPLLNFADFLKYFQPFQKIVIFINGIYQKHLPSTVYNIDTDEVLREGVINYEQICFYK